jgi:hypothetical protein
MRQLAVAVVLAVGLGLTAFGSTTDELTISSGSSTVTITDNGVGDVNPANGVISYNNSNFNGWNISVATGTSYSPGLIPYGLDVASLTATCDLVGGCTTQSLIVTYSDINFNTPVPIGDFLQTFSTTDSGPGTATENAWFDNTNTLFGTQNSIGTVGPFGTSNIGFTSGGTVAAVPNYSLTLQQVFTDTSATSAVSFSADGNITAVPEPAAVVLFGSLLALCATGLRRRRLAQHNR